MEIRAFFNAIANDWVALMSGIGSIVLLGLSITIFYERPFPRWIVLAIGLACFFLAAAKVWTTEHRKYLAEARKNNPMLVGNFEDVGIPDGAKEIKSGEQILAQSALVLIRFTITNRGTASIVRNYLLRVRLAGGHDEIEAVSWAVPPTINWHDGKRPRLFRAEDALYDKTLPMPLATGAAVTGLLLFGVPNVSPESLRQVGTTFQLSYDDVMEKKYTATFTWTGQLDLEVRHYPGMKPETT